MMPLQKPGRSKQDYGTPADFLKAVTIRFGKMAWDLAASDENHKAPKWFTEEQGSLARDWTRCKGNLWLNPPFENIGVWAHKCTQVYKQIEGKIFLLVPASIGSNWFASYVYPHALVHAIQGRLTFEGCTTPYPKDCILAVYGFEPGFKVWDWRKT